MPELFPTTFTIESSLALPVDTFEARYPGAAVFLGRTPDTVVTLAPGLYDDVGLAIVTEQIVQGIVSEWEFSREITGDHESVVTRVRGYDPARKLAETYVRKRYVRPSTVAPTTAVTPEAGAIPEVRGAFAYATIAAESCAAAGLGVAWQLPNPIVQHDFTANGRVLDVLTALARPWTAGEPTRADVYIEGTTVIVKQRDPAPTTGVTLSVAELRPSSVRLIARPPKPIGVIVIRGLVTTTTTQTTTPGGGGGGGTTVILNPNDPTTVLVNTETTTARYEYLYGKPPNGVLSRGDKQVFARIGGTSTLVARQLITNDWDTVLFDGGQPTTVPRQRRGFSEFQGVDTADSTFKTLRTELRTFSYDDEGYLTEERTLIRKLTKGGATGTTEFLQDSDLTVRTIVGEGPLLISDDTIAFIPDSDRGFFATGEAVAWKFKSHTSGSSGGHRPGGPGRQQRRTSGTQTSTSAGSSSSTTTSVGTVVTSPGTAGGRTIEISCPDLDAGQCQQIHDQLRAWASAWEYEVQITAPTVPWIRRGMALRLTGVITDDGTPVPDHAMTVYETKVTHDESSERGRSTMTVRAGWWAA
jgi:hypothetical protein